MGTATIDPVNDTLTYAFTTSGLSGSLTGAHFHGPAARGNSAAAKVDILAQPDAGTVSYAPSDEADLLGGMWYVNYHTAAFPAGEVRGQLDMLGGVFAVNASVQGGGSVASSPSGIDCASSCIAAFAEGATVTLTATPNALSEFVGWQGDCSGEQPVCVLSVDAAKDATARFRMRADAPVRIFANGFE